MEKTWERRPEPHNIRFHLLQQRSRTIYIGSMLYQLFPPKKIFTRSTAQDKLKQVLSENQSAHVGFDRYTGSPIKELNYNFLYGTLHYLWTHGLTERRRTEGARTRYRFLKEYGGFLQEPLDFEYRFLEESRPMMEQFVQLSGIRI